MGGEPIICTDRVETPADKQEIATFPGAKLVFEPALELHAELDRPPGIPASRVYITGRNCYSALGWLVE